MMEDSNPVASCGRLVAGSCVIVAALAAGLGETPLAEAQQTALVFDGVDDIATIPNTNEWPILSSSLTVEAWIRPSDLSVQELIAIVWGGQTGSFSLQHGSHDPSKLSWTISRGPTHSAQSPTGALAVGRWDHFAGTYDGTTLRLYRNGKLIDEEPHDSPGDVAVRGEVVLALRPNAPNFAGTIDELRVWVTVRTEEQIKARFERPVTGTEPDLIGYWRLDDASGQVVSDSSSISNDGVLGSTTAVEPEDPVWTGETAPLAFFYDGFEPGTTNGWSASVGG